MKPTGQQFLVEFLGCSNRLINDKKALERILKTGIDTSGLHAVHIDGYQFQPSGVTLFAIISESHIAIHTYPEAQHASIDIFTCAPAGQGHMTLLNYLKVKLRPKAMRYIETQRGNPITVRQQSWFSEFDTNGYEVRYHIKQYLLSKRTTYQQMDIIDNDDFGVMLFLDHELQIAESDAHIYNKGLIAPVVQSHKQLGSVAILGGGDGGVLYDLLNYKPLNVQLVDLDKQVIDSAQTYLRPICNNAFSNPAVQIHIADANSFLEKTHSCFDAIICDLTMHPEKGMSKKREAYWRTLLAQVRIHLTKNGSVSLQCGSEQDKKTLRFFSRLLPQFFKNVSYKKEFIPSFCERWVFASGTKM